MVLDEPSSNLDSEGEAALTNAIMSVRRRGGIVIVITHRPKSLDAVDKVLVVGNGTVQAFGEKEEVLSKVLRNPPRAAADGRQWREDPMSTMIESDPAQHSIQRYLLLGIILAALLTFGIGGWAATTELSSAVIAQGSLVVDSSVKKVQHPSGGIVSELRVRNGDRVRAGDILLRLDETQSRAAATIIIKNVDELLAREARLETERDNAGEITFPPALLDPARQTDSDAARAIAAERSLFNLRRQAREGQKSQLKERGAQLQEEIKGYSGQLEAKKKEVEFIQKELDGVRTLWEKNLVPISRLTALERDADPHRGRAQPARPA